MFKKCLKRTFFVLIVFALVLVATAIVTYRSLPEGITRTASAWLAPDESSGDMARAILAQNAGHPGLSGVYPFANGRDAFLARLALAEAADKSLDVQYYIWHNDTSGYLLLQALYRAAERGVRVRLLLDDNNTHGMDGLLRTLNDHPNAEVRLYNPFMQRNHRLLGYLSDFFRLNRRMHNKSYSADGVINIVGGRNVGDEYFGAGEGTMFLDMDVAVSGSVVPAIETDFDRYWASESVWPLEAIIAADTVAEPIAATPRDDAATRAYLAQLKESDFATRLKNGSLEQSWSPARLLSDDPAKGLGKARYEDTVIAHITPYFAAARNNINIVSPYFVPTHKGSDALIEAAGQGRKIRILTNSLAATDVAPVHAGYAKYRKALLAGGVALYELKPDAEANYRPHGKAGIGGSIAGSSGASLHAKTFSIDGTQIFVGSFNMDPRSATLNTEMGILFDQPQLAALFDNTLGVHLPQESWQVSLDDDGKLQWQSQGETLHEEPQSSAFRRALVSVFSWLPIESLL